MRPCAMHSSGHRSCRPSESFSRQNWPQRRWARSLICPMPSIGHNLRCARPSAARSHDATRGRQRSARAAGRLHAGAVSAARATARRPLGRRPPHSARAGPGRGVGDATLRLAHWRTPWCAISCSDSRCVARSRCCTPAAFVRRVTQLPCPPRVLRRHHPRPCHPTTRRACRGGLRPPQRSWGPR